MIIHLGPQLPAALKRHNPRTPGGPPLTVLLFGLGSGWGLPSFPVTGKLVSSYLAFSPYRAMAGGIFSVALSLRVTPSRR